MCDCCPCCDCDWFSEKAGSLDEKKRNDPKGGVVQYQPLPSDLDCSSEMDRGKEAMEEIDIVLPRFEKIPVEKIFSFEQPVTPSYVHPQLFTIMENADDRTYPPLRISPSSTTFSPTPDQHNHPATSDDDSLVHSSVEPNVFFSLYFDFQRRALTVHLQAASGLKCLVKSKRGSLTRTTDMFPSPSPTPSRTPTPTLPGDPDTFVMLVLIPLKEQSFTSTMKPKSSNPKFNETFEFIGILPEEIRRQSLVFRFYNKTKQNELGIMVLPLEDIDMYGVNLMKPIMSIDSAAKTLELQDYDSYGEVLISLMHDPSDGVISGIVLKAKNLQKMDLGGLSDPYVKIYLIHKGERIDKWKSTIKKKTLTPIYNESFQFHVAGRDLHYIKLQLIVLDHDTLGTNDKMGYIEFATKSDHHGGQSHWNEVISSPRNQFCYWHTLAKPSTIKRFSIK